MFSLLVAGTHGTPPAPQQRSLGVHTPPEGHLEVQTIARRGCTHAVLSRTTVASDAISLLLTPVELGPNGTFQPLAKRSGASRLETVVGRFSERDESPLTG